MRKATNSVPLSLDKFVDDKKYKKRKKNKGKKNNQGFLVDLIFCFHGSKKWKAFFKRITKKCRRRTWIVTFLLLLSVMVSFEYYLSNFHLMVASSERMFQETSPPSIHQKRHNDQKQSKLQRKGQHQTSQTSSSIPMRCKA